jgi:hypothetical protein
MPAEEITFGKVSSIDQSIRDANAHAGHIAAPPLASVGDREFGSAAASTNPRIEMEHYIREQNLAHYRKVLSETTDPKKRQILLKLLADEQVDARKIASEAAGPLVGQY